MTDHATLELLALNGSPSATSKTHALAARAVDIVGSGQLVDLCDLDAEALLGRRLSPDVTALLEAIQLSRLLLVATPIYRATFSGLLKVLFDQLAPGALTDVVCVLAATGGGPLHFLAVDTGLRPLIASLNGLSTPTPVYLIGADFTDDGRLGETAEATLAQALSQAVVLAYAIEAK